MRRPLLISHDLSCSGAPVALLSLAQALQRLGERPMVAAIAGGPLARSFHASGIEMTTRIDPTEVAFVVANTVLSVPAALRFKRFGIPVAAWLHESTYFFRTAGVSPQESGLPGLDLILVPAVFQVRELSPLAPAGGFYQLRNLVQQPWFRPPDGDATLAVCGHWETRKGQARLLELARLALPRCRFKFIGPERPDEPAATESTESAHRFLGSLEPDAARYEIARSDGLVSCAEAEVQPLSVIEALMAGRPTLLSDIDAHRALAERIPNVALFDRASAASFLAGYSRLRAAMVDAELGRSASATANSLFGEATFDRRVGELLKVLRSKGSPGAEVERFQEA